MAKKRAARLPARLERLRRESSAWGQFAGDFEFEREGSDAALAWFQGRAAPASKFLVFGRNRGGDLYALWLRKGAAVAAAPVVRLNTDRFADVVASTIDEFVSLLALDIPRLGSNEKLGAQAPAKTAGHGPFMKWLLSEGLSRPGNPDALIRSALNTHYQEVSDYLEDVMSSDGPPPQPVKQAAFPTDPTTLLGRNVYRAPKASPSSGVTVTRQDDTGPVKAISLRPGKLSPKLRPFGLDLSTIFGQERSSVLAHLAGYGFDKPSRTGERWDRFDRGDVGLHLEYGEGLTMITLMWLPATPGLR